MIDLVIDEAVQADEATCALVERAIQTALAHRNNTGSVGVLLTSEQEIRRLNREDRNMDRVTDGVSFPAGEAEQIAAPPDGYLGDIAICMARAAEQAQTYGHSLERETAFLAVHGTLHLLGFDHMNESEERIMRGQQKEIMEEMGLTVG